MHAIHTTTTHQPLRNTRTLIPLHIYIPNNTSFEMLTSHTFHQSHTTQHALRCLCTYTCASITHTHHIPNADILHIHNTTTPNQHQAMPLQPTTPIHTMQKRPPPTHHYTERTHIHLYHIQICHATRTKHTTTKHPTPTHLTTTN